MDSIRTYRVRSLHEALQLIRADLGPEAAVLHTREVPRGWFGWQRELEVTASAEISPPSRLSPALDLVVEDHFDDEEGIEDRVIQTNALANEAAWESAAYAHSDRMKNAFSVLEKQSARIDREETAPDTQWPQIEQALRQTGFSVDFILEAQRSWQQQFSRQHSADQDPQRWMLQQVRSDLPLPGSLKVPRGQQTIVALVGPTGVGKTTSLAKLAAEFSLQQNRRVGLITVDTYRIGAVEQLRTYAEIMKLPMEVAASPDEMHSALDQLGDCELILIDTAGRSPLDALQMRELAAVLAAAEPHETHLVVSAVAQVEGLPDMAERFLAVGANRLLLTKTDEARFPGRIFDFLRSTHLPVSYIANGQNVPADLCSADADRLAEWLLGTRPSAAL